MSLRLSARQAALFTSQDSKPAKPSDRTRWKVKLEDQMANAGVPMWDEEYAFAAVIGRKWRFDYAWPSLRLALELEGGAFGRSILGADGKWYRLGSGHNTGKFLTKDILKYNRAAILGWLVIRATTTMVRDGQAIGELLDAFKARRVS